MKSLGRQTLAISDIDFGQRLRAVDQAHAQLLAENIRQCGKLRTPIEVRQVTAPGPPPPAGRPRGPTGSPAHRFACRVGALHGARVPPVDSGDDPHVFNASGGQFFVSPRGQFLASLDNILASEGGASLRASGWRLLGMRGGAWGREGPPRVDAHPTEPKLLFERTA